MCSPVPSSRSRTDSVPTNRFETLVRFRARVIDQVVLAAWDHFAADLRDRCALVAVGGYGPRRAASPFRRRSHGAPGQDRRRGGGRGHQPVLHVPLGHRAGSRAFRSHTRGLRGRIPQRRHRHDDHDGVAPAHRAGRPVQHLRATHRAGSRVGLRSVFPRQMRRTGGPSSRLRRYRLQAGAQHQGQPGRTAGHSDHRLDRPAPSGFQKPERTALPGLSDTGPVADPQNGPGRFSGAYGSPCT